MPTIMLLLSSLAHTIARRMLPASCLLLLLACGQKAPLYLPPDPAGSEVIAPTTPAEPAP